ncbi:heme exporter protein CcmD, partial [Alcanivorax sp.]
MAFESFADFLAMGKHGFYVWSAYGVSALLIIANMALAIRAQGQVRQRL